MKSSNIEEFNLLVDEYLKQDSSGPMSRFSTS